MTGSARKHSRRRPLVAIGALLLALTLFCVFFRTGLRYQGQRLEYWVVQLKQGDKRNKALARDALQSFGSRAVQPLIDVVQHEDPDWKVSLIRRFPVLYRFLPATWPQDRAYAAAALGELGPIATNAIPALERVTASDPGNDAMVTAALMKIRREPLAPLFDDLTDWTARNWVNDALEVAEFGTNAKPALPVLCSVLTNSAPNAPRWAAAYAIGKIRADPSLCVPALIESVKVGGKVNINSIWALGEFEDDARAAIPLLYQEANDPDSMVRQSVLGSLKRILPTEQQTNLVPFLEANLNDPDPNLRGSAKHMLRQLRDAGIK
jgi:HEAT repeat protein